MIYQKLADRLQALIGEQVFPVGNPLPGVRRLSMQYKVSVTTAVNACRELERRGMVEARPRSGFFVRMPPVLRETPRAGNAGRRPLAITGQERVLRMLQAANDPGIVNLGAAVPDARMMPAAAIEKAFHHVLRTQRGRCAGYEFPPGAPELRVQIARRLAGLQCDASPDKVLITHGCQESITIALKLLTRPGDTVAIESPSYYGLLQIIESLGLKALEIPTDPAQGISLEALSQALERWPVAACVVISNFSNPLGACLSDERKQALCALTARHGVPLVEDDIYGDLPFHGRRPRPLKSWDTRGMVYYCGSASKTLSAGLRVGWLVPGHQHGKGEYLQYVNSIAVATPSQLALAHFLAHGRHDQLLRQACLQYSRAVARMTEQVTRLFPPQTRISRPAGGFVLWVELPGRTDTTALMEQALEAGVSFAPGALFSASGKYANCLRLNCAVQWNARVERALAALAGLL